MTRFLLGFLVGFLAFPAGVPPSGGSRLTGCGWALPNAVRDCKRLVKQFRPGQPQDVYQVVEAEPGLELLEEGVTP